MADVLGSGSRSLRDPTSHRIIQPAAEGLSPRRDHYASTITPVR